MSHILVWEGKMDSAFKCSYLYDYYLIHVLIELQWACNNDCVMFVHYMSFDMRINNKYLLNWTELKYVHMIKGSLKCSYNNQSLSDRGFHL